MAQRENGLRRISLALLVVGTSLFFQIKIASASTYIFTLPVTETLTIDGNISTPFAISAELFVSATGVPAFDQSNDGMNTFVEWQATAEVGPLDLKIYDTNCTFVACTAGEEGNVPGGGIVIDVLPYTLQITGNAEQLYSTYTGPISVSGELVLDLPDGVTVTPLPATLPLFAGGLGILSLIARRRKRTATDVLATT
jgi:hypothetical protein